MHRVQTHEDFVALWNRHRGIEDPAAAVMGSGDDVECPSIDFSHCEVIAVFTMWNASGGVHLAQMREEQGLRRLRLQRDVAQRDGGNGTMRRRRHAEYGFFVLPRREVPVVIEVDRSNLIGEAPVWEAVARL